MINHLYNKMITHYHQPSAIIPHKVALELLERLRFFHYFQPNTILEVGCGTGSCLKLLQKTYPLAQCFGVDSSYERLIQAKNKTFRWFSSSPTLMLGEIEKLQFVDQQFDLIFANLSLLWVRDLKQCLLKFKKILRPNGLLIFTMLAPGSFKELKTNSSFNSADTVPWAFCDLHHLGDILMQHRLHDIVVDTDSFKVHYSSLQAAYRDLEDMGFAALISHKKNLEAAFNMRKNHDISITWEVVYAQAWRLSPKKAFYNADQQEITIPLDRIKHH